MNLIKWFEIPAKDFNRAVKFYNTIFDIELKKFEWETEKMAFFPEETNIGGAVSEAKDFNPSTDGVVVYFDGTDNLDKMIQKVIKAGGSILREKTKIDDNKGEFCLMKDTEGNRIGFYSK